MVLAKLWVETPWTMLTFLNFFPVRFDPNVIYYNNCKLNKYVEIVSLISKPKNYADNVWDAHMITKSYVIVDYVAKWF